MTKTTMGAPPPPSPSSRLFLRQQQGKDGKRGEAFYLQHASWHLGPLRFLHGQGIPLPKKAFRQNWHTHPPSAHLFFLHPVRNRTIEGRGVFEYIQCQCQEAQNGFRVREKKGQSLGGSFLSFWSDGIFGATHSSQQMDLNGSLSFLTDHVSTINYCCLQHQACRKTWVLFGETFA